MATSPTRATPQEQELLAAARGGDEGAFGRLLESYRSELHAHCYRMLGSVQDAEDALQDASLRAWRGLARFEGRSSLRSWLYTIATNSSLNLIARRPKQRVLPLDYGPSTDPHDGIGLPPAETVWVDPYPDEGLGLEDGPAGPEARYELRESVELAFVAALQHLPANQRAALILREVLGFSAREVAESLDTTVASVNSALQRARKTIDDDAARAEPAGHAARARRRAPARARGGLHGRDAAGRRGGGRCRCSPRTRPGRCRRSRPGSAATRRSAGFMHFGPLSGDWRWRHVPTRANGQPAVGSYAWYEPDECFRPFALDVMTFDGDRIGQITSFINRSTLSSDLLFYERWPGAAHGPRQGGRLRALRPARPPRPMSFRPRAGL